MVALVRTYWSGTTGGPGITQMALLGAAGGIWNPGGEQGAVNAVRAFWDALKTYIPDEVQLTVSPVVDWYDRATGELMGSNIAATPPGVVLGTSATSYAGGSGFKVTWETGQIRDGRRVRGATYVVPCSSGVFTNTGVVSSTPKAAINTAANAMLTALTTNTTPMGVWSRPREATDDLPARAGAAFQVSVGVCSSKSAILRGRRD
jgi:hypothetical protein